MLGCQKRKFLESGEHEGLESEANESSGQDLESNDPNGFLIRRGRLSAGSRDFLVHI